jgi:hypothetical protein
VEEILRSLAVSGSRRTDFHFADLKWANDICLHRDDILLVLKLALDQQGFAEGDNAPVRLIPPPLAASRPFPSKRPADKRFRVHTLYFLFAN